jgi:hypothetical protein
LTRKKVDGISAYERHQPPSTVIDMPETTTLADRCRLTAGPITFDVDASEGGRIVSFAWEGRETLTQRPVHPLCFGSTFWDAPQSAWNWPPRAILDSGAYDSAKDGGSLVLTSAVDSGSGLRFVKRFTPDAARQRIEIVYTIRNEKSAGAVGVGPWEVTRVPGGLSFFPLGAPAALPPSALPHTVDEHGIVWYRFDASALTSGRKLFATGSEGWLAHRSDDGLLIVKRFAPITAPSRPAPEHGEIELWGQDGGIYVEIESHGPYTRLEPGESVDYRVHWYLRPVEDGLTDTALVERVRALVAEDPLAG